VEKNVNNRCGFTLVEIMVVIAILSIILGVSAGPFLKMLGRGKIEDRVSTMHETFKSAQTQAMKRGDVEIVGGQIIKQKIYLGVNQTTGTYRVVQWRDANNDNVRDATEFTLLQEDSLKGTHFGFLGTVNKKACSNNAGAPADSVVNLTTNSCPSLAAQLTGYRCARFDGKGFMEAMNNAAVYVTNDIDSFAISINPAGIMTLCRWDVSAWTFVR
jgi:prepilin-type N-terminal cleavage/methylation domain-containing protein